jgi:DNA uptake protein ComE-like DNA-binding protein
MIKNRIRYFLKTYFYFSSNERKGAFGFVFLIICVAIAPIVYRFVYPISPPTITVHGVTQLTDTLEPPITSTQSIHKVEVKNELDFVIDPNAATEQEWKRLGMKSWQIKNIKKYQAKGGQFKSIEDVGKIYGLSSIDFEKMKPHLFIKHTEAKRDSIVSKPQFKTNIIELNSADTNALKSLYGIGSKMAGKIVDYRGRLGGYNSLNQLTEIWGFNEDLLYDLKGKLVLDTSKIYKIPINSVSQETLSLHPYIKIRLSKIIVNYRQQHGPYRIPADLKKTLVVQDSTIIKITPYLDFSF